jgi:outer membrane protein TolC
MIRIGGAISRLMFVLMLDNAVDRPATAWSQDATSLASGLNLEDVVNTTLLSSPDVLLAAQRVETAQGTWISSRAGFDLKVQTSGNLSRLNLDSTSDTPSLQNGYRYSLGLQQLLRNGVSVAPAVSLTRNALSTRPGEDTNVADVGLTVSVPLLRDRGGAASHGTERAAERDYEAARLDLQYVTAQRALAGIIAYWDYAAACRRLDVQRDSEERAKQSVQEMRVLIEADERAAADLTQVQGNLAAKRVARVAAEQSVLEMRQQLGLIMGLPPEAILALASPSTPFPATPDSKSDLDPRALVRAAYARRSDLAAAEVDLQTSTIALDVARTELRPRLDVVVNTGYRATDTGPGFARFFSPLHPRSPRLDAAIQLKYERPTSNSSARGHLMQSAATEQQRRIALDDLRRRIDIAVSVALEALARGEATMKDSDESVQFFESGVEAVQRKFQLGVSTVFDLIQAQDALTSARLGQVQSQRTYAVAIATLRFQSGGLVEPSSERPFVPLERLLTRPANWEGGNH